MEALEKGLLHEGKWDKIKIHIMSSILNEAYSSQYFSRTSPFNYYFYALQNYILTFCFRILKRCKRTILGILSIAIKNEPFTTVPR